MFRRNLLGCMAAFMVQAAAGLPDVGASDQADGFQLPHWRSAVMCGPNSLFLILSSTGYCEDYDQLRQEFQPTPRGVSVTELLRVAQDYGCDLQAYQMDFDDLGNTPTPAILHFKPIGGVGHFVVLLDVAKDYALVMDSTTGETSQLNRGSLQDVWTGVVLCKRRSLVDSRVMSLLGLCASIALLAVVVAQRTKAGSL